MTATADDEFTELVDADFPRVDLVGKGANGIPRFLIAKQNADTHGLLPASLVRDLIGKEAPAPASSEETLTMTGTPAAIADFIHKAAKAQVSHLEDVAKAMDAYPDDPIEVAKSKAEYDLIVKAKYKQADRDRMAGSGAAMKDGSYPIEDEEDLHNAIRAVGRGGADHDAIRRHVISRAKSLGKSSMIPDSWGSDGSIKKSADGEPSEPVAKAPGDEGDPVIDLDQPLAQADMDAPGDPNTPGSPAWEAIDAATAQKWTQVLARARVAIDMLAQREYIEAASGADPDDIEDAFELDNVCCAIDYAIGVLAPFAVAEQSEADQGLLAAIGKALGGDHLDAPLAVIEGLAALKQVGVPIPPGDMAARAASKVRKALAMLPPAPPPSTETPADTTVAKQEETTVSDTPAPAAGDDVAKAADEPVVKEAPADQQAAANAPVQAGGTTHDGEPGRDTQPDQTADGRANPVRKADDGDDGDGSPATQGPLQPIYDAKGKLCGVVDPDAIIPVSGMDDGDGDGDHHDDGDGAGELEPQPAAEAGTPASGALGQTDDGDVAKAAEVTPPTNLITVTPDVLESIVAKAVAAALDSKGQAEDVAKSAVAAVSDEVDALKARLAVVEEQPAVPKVFTNGAVPPQHMLRGQDQGTSAQIDVAKAMDRRRELYGAPTATDQNRIAQEMQADAIAALGAIHQARR